MIDTHRLKNEILQLLNWIRVSPGEVATALTTRLPFYRGVYIHFPSGKIIKTMQGISAIEELIAQLNLSVDVGPLEWSPGLARAAEVHAHQMGNLGTVSHKDFRNNDLPERLKPYCDVKGKALQLIELSGVDSKQILFELLIDDGLASRSRRKSIISPFYKYVGVGIARHKIYGSITVIILAQSASEIQYQFPAQEVIVVPQFVPQSSGVVVSEEIPIYRQMVPVVQNVGDQNLYQSVKIVSPPLQIIPEIPQSHITRFDSHVPQDQLVQIRSKSLDVINDLSRNRLLYAQTYNKNIFGGEKNQQCLLF